jgi:hypothetical protein
MEEMIRNKLIEAARAKKVVYYSEIGEILNLSMNNPSHRKEIGRILGEISTEEDQAGRPLLSAVVVHKENHQPGKGFFQLARELGKQKPDENDDVFFAAELQKVFDKWAKEKD